MAPIDMIIFFITLAIIIFAVFFFGFSYKRSQPSKISNIRDRKIFTTIDDSNNILYLIALAIAALGFIDTTLALSLGGAFVVILVFKRRRQRQRTVVFFRELPAAIEKMDGSLRSGNSILSSMEYVGYSSDSLLSMEFRRISREISLGRDIGETFSQSSTRFPIDDYRLLTTALVLQMDTGGDVRNVLRVVLDSIRAKNKMKLKVKSMTSESRATMFLLSSFPFVIVAAIYYLRPAYISPMFYDPNGQILLGIALGLLLIGVVVLQVMTSIDEING